MKKINDKKKRIVDVFISNIITLIFMLIFVIMVFFVFCTMTNRAPSVLGFQILRISTGSMEPTYPVDSYIIIKKTDPLELKENDVISFYSKNPDIYGMVNTHRIVGISGDGDNLSFTTKGDANPVADNEAVAQSDIIGKVIIRASIFDWIGKMLRNQYIYFFIVIIPLAIMMLKELRNVVYASMELKKENEENKIKNQTIDELKETKTEKDGQSLALEQLVEQFGEGILDMIEEEKKSGKRD